MLFYFFSLLINRSRLEVRFKSICWPKTLQQGEEGLLGSAPLDESSGLLKGVEMIQCEELICGSILKLNL